MWLLYSFTYRPYNYVHYSSEISEESELQLTTKMNEVIKQRWVALGPRNYGKSIEWKLEGEPWDTEGLYADHTRGVYLLCLLLEAIQPLGWRLVSSAGEIRNGILLPKLFWPTVRKNCSSDRDFFFEIRGWRPRICKNFEITKTICSNSERSEQFLVTECFFNLFLEVSHI